MNIDAMREKLRQPAWSLFFDRLALAHPLTFWRVACFKRVNWKPLLYSCAALALPVTFIREKEQLATYVVSPWTLAWYYKAFMTCRSLFSSMRDIWNSRSRTKDSAYECLVTQVEKGRAFRTRRYDLYLPKKPVGSRLIMFFTGAHVEHVAYSEPATMLSDAGFTVVVLSAEPLLLVDTWLPGFWVQTLLFIFQSVSLKYDCSGWILAGHSMGSFACTKLAVQLGVRDIVMWGSAPFCDFMDDLSQENVRVLVVQAEKDLVVDMFATDELWKLFWSLLPDFVDKAMIEGGTHSGFASYESTWKAEVDGILPNDQQAEAVRLTATFLQM